MGGHNFKDLTGKKFGRLTVIERGSNLGDNVRWHCVCECGNHTLSHTSSLTSGRTKSCGCLSREKFVQSRLKHGKTKTKIYQTWTGMKKRCFAKSYEHYDCYGGRGITVCDEWLGENGFVNFYNWAISNGYAEDLEIDRIDTNGNYCPENCRWVSRTYQVRNRRTTILLEHNNEKKTLKEWCQIYQVDYKLAHQRYKKGWNFERIFSKHYEK